MRDTDLRPSHVSVLQQNAGSVLHRPAPLQGGGYMRVAELIINWRFIRKLNQRDAAKEMGISASSLCRIEKGIVPDGTTLVTLMNWLFGESQHETKVIIYRAPDSGDQRQDVSSPASEG
jgi:DNA-binding XRE family transcriptional regulator